jgi:peroxiredoxin
VVKNPLEFPTIVQQGMAMRVSLRCWVWMLLSLMAAGLAHAGDLSGQERAVAAAGGLVGTAAPGLTVKTMDGAVIDLGALYGKQAVYLKFWATWCTPCREQMPHFQHVYETAGADLAVIAVNVGFNDPPEEVRKFRQQYGITMPVVVDDGRLAQAFHLRVTPQHIVIGRDGRIQYVGHLADAQLDTALNVARNTPVLAPPAPGSGAQSAGSIPALRVGELLPAASVRTLDGHAVPLRQDTPGRPSALVFLSPWCESYLATTRPTVSARCREARERVAALAHHSKVNWLGIASGLWATPDELREYQLKHRIAIALTLDESGALFRQFGVTDTPTIVLADAQGRIVRRIEAGQLEELAPAIAQLRATATKGGA